MKRRNQNNSNNGKITIEDVARYAGVSISTVSRVMNNNYHHISDETKQKVLNAITELDYRPNALAKGLKQMKTNAIGVILSNLQNPFWLKVLEGIEDTCQEAGYSLMILNSRDNLKKEENNVKEFLTRQLDGIIINPSNGENPIFHDLIRQEFPLIFLNRKVVGLSADTVVVDNVQGSMLAIDHLIKLNKKRIAIFLYPTNGISPRIERIEGYKKGHLKHGLDLDHSLIRIVNNKNDCIEQIKLLLEDERKIDAIFSTNNMLTLEILDALDYLGVKVPDKIGVLGYDETEWSKHLNPALTTIKQPAYEMGRGAAERLIKIIDLKIKNEKWVPEVIQYKPSLIVRRSCGEPEYF